jgi:hypothetical protein
MVSTDCEYAPQPAPGKRDEIKFGRGGLRATRRRHVRDVVVMAAEAFFRRLYFDQFQRETFRRSARLDEFGKRRQCQLKTSGTYPSL